MSARARRVGVGEAAAEAAGVAFGSRDLSFVTVTSKARVASAGTPCEGEP